MGKYYLLSLIIIFIDFLDNVLLLSKIIQSMKKNNGNYE